MIRKILVPVRGDGKGANVLAHAAALGRRTNAHLTVTHCRARPEDMLPYGVPIPRMMRDVLVKQAKEMADHEETGLREDLARQAEKLGLELSESQDFKVPTAHFVEEAGRQVDVIKHYGRLADIIAVAQPDRQRNLGVNSLKAALFQTGRPVLMCPDVEEAPKELGRKVTIAWNGSMEASRAVALAMPVIEAASEVIILFVGKQDPFQPPPEDLQSYLRMRGIESSIVRSEGKKNVAQGLLDQSNSLGADLLIMGAYGESHERETLFGGNTQSVVDKARMPVLMVH